MNVNLNTEFIEAAASELERVLGTEVEILTPDDLFETIDSNQIGTTVDVNSQKLQTSMIKNLLSDPKYTGLVQKVVAYANGETSENPFSQELLKPLPAERKADIDDVRNAVNELVDINQAVTTNEVKQYLRNAGLRAYQSDVSALMNELFEAGEIEFSLVTLNGKSFRNYKRAYGFNPSALMDFSDWDIEPTVTSDPVVDSNSDDLQGYLNAWVDGSKASRNFLITKAFDDGYSIKEIAALFMLSPRQIGRITSGR